MVWDNFQRGQELRDQRGGCSSKFLIGTVEAAHLVVPFLNIRWKDHNVFMRHDHLQSGPSPLGMWRYESLDPFSPTFGSVFLKHSEIYVPDSPCFSGDRVHSYEYIIHLWKHVCDMSRAFPRLFDWMEVGVGANHIAKFYKYSATNKSIQMTQGGEVVCRQRCRHNDKPCSHHRFRLVAK